MLRYSSMGARGETVPRDVVRVQVDLSLTLIPTEAFRQRNKLAEGAV